jgi:hypothetical protein
MGVQQMLLAGGFQPVSSIYTTVQSGTTEMVPANASLCTITVWGSGGSGSSAGSGNCQGGSAGGKAVFGPFLVAAGNTFTVNLAAGGAGVSNPNSGNLGGNASVSGTPLAGALTLTGFGGQGGTSTGTGVGGTGGGTGIASAPTVTNGANGSFGSSASEPGGPGTNGIGGGTNGRSIGGTTANGNIGQVEFDYT